MGRGSTKMFSWFASNSYLPFNLRLDDRRTGALIAFSGNRYIVRIGATAAVSAYQDGEFQCGSFSTSRGSQYNCRV